MAFNTDDEGLRAERALDMFMRDVVVPLAAKTNAVVLVAPYSCCAMSVAFCKAATMAKGKYGDHLPFTTLAFVNAIWLMGPIKKQIATSMAVQIYNSCPAWKRHKGRINVAYRNAYGPALADNFELMVSNWHFST